MRSSETIIKTAIGDANYEDFIFINEYEDHFIEVYRINFCDTSYLGLISPWYFGIIRQRSSASEKSSDRLQLIKHFIENHLSNNRNPLILISDDTSVRLSDKLYYQGKLVFFIDRENLKSIKKQTKSISHSPFIMSVRKKLNSKDISSLIFTPYKPSKPAIGWRFFGRKNEISKLTNSDESFFVVGARRIGKTSLLMETERILKKQGRKVYRVDVQHLNTARKVVEAIITTISPKEKASAIRRKKVLGENLLTSALKTINRRNERVTIILDELGNVVRKYANDDWGVIGQLREYSHTHNLQIIMSGFQEFFIKQMDDFSGPFINFADVIRLKAFNDDEIEQTIIEPLQIWGRIKNKNEMLKRIIADVGRQPYLLQYLGRELFSRLFRRGARYVDNILDELLNIKNIGIFRPPVEELFFRMGSASQRYVFLKYCRENDIHNRPIADGEINDSWLKSSFKEIDIESNLNGRRLLLERLEVHGLTESVYNNPSRQKICTPIIYNYLRETEPSIDDLISTFVDEMRILENNGNDYGVMV